MPWGDGGTITDPRDTVLAAWTSVFPLSQSPGHRVRLQIGPDVSAEVVTAVVDDYLRALDEFVPSPCWINADGDLRGPREFERTARDVLFTAVFSADLDAIVRRHLRSDGARAT